MFFFDQARCAEAVFAYWALLRYSLTHSLVMSFLSALDADDSYDTHIKSMSWAVKWWQSRPQSLLTLLVKYSFGLVFVLCGLLFLLLGSIAKIALWTAFAILVLPSCSLAAVRLRTY